MDFLKPSTVPKSKRRQILHDLIRCFTSKPNKLIEMFTTKFCVFLWFLTYVKQYSSRTRIKWNYFISHLMTATRLCKQSFVVSAIRSMSTDTCQNVMYFRDVKIDGNASIELRSAQHTHPLVHLARKMRHRRSLCT